MGWLRKRQSPLERRRQELEAQLAEIRKREAELLRARQAPPAERPPQPDTPAPKPAAPRIHHTTRPGGVSPIHGIEPHELGYSPARSKPVDFDRSPSSPAAGDRPSLARPPAPEAASSPMIQKIISLIARPAPSPPRQARLPELLTTGSFQRLKPLRYEKRVARNRIILLGIILLAIAFLLVKCVTR